MGRISATFKPTIEAITKAYADFNGISFSESVEILTSLSGMEWFMNLPKGTRKMYQMKFPVTKSTKSNNHGKK